MKPIRHIWLLFIATQAIGRPLAPFPPPEESLPSFSVPQGFTVELVASEPLIHDPVALAFDEDGRIFVVEMHGYHGDLDDQGEPLPSGRVVVLEDTTGDGRIDSNSVYLDNLLLPRAVAVANSGILVGEPPHIWFARDTTGDGRADEKIIVANDYGQRGSNTEHAPNGLIRGLDNWFYSARFDGRFRLSENKWIREPGFPRGQWGITMDNYGRIYFNWTRQHLRGSIVSEKYALRNPAYPHRPGVTERIAHDEKVWPHPENPAAKRLALRTGGEPRFISACGPAIYRGNRFPKEFQGNAFVAEPAYNLVRRSIVGENDDGTLYAHNPYERTEFLTSTDELFRPVNLYTGPDGALYIVDLHLPREQFMNTNSRNRTAYRATENFPATGRIYRVVYNRSEPARLPALSQATSQELVQTISNPNGWWRDTAQRLLVERHALETIPHLIAVAGSHDDELARLHALWTLEGLGLFAHPEEMALEGAEEILLRALQDDSPHVRSAAVRLAEPWLATPSSTLTEVLTSMLDDPVALARLQLALSAGEAGRIGEPLLAELLTRHADQPYLLDAVLSGLNERELDFLRALLADKRWTEYSPARAAAFGAIAASAFFADVPERTNDMLSLVASENRLLQWQRLAILDGIENHLPRNRRGEILPMILQEEPAALTALLRARDQAVGARAASVFEHLFWPEKEGAAEAAIAGLSALERTLFTRGRENYLQTCAGCHQADGRGAPGLSPGLTDSPFIDGSHRIAVMIALHGIEGSDGSMPPMSGLDDNTIASILTYIRRKWGAPTGPVTPGAIAEIRLETRGRNEPYTRQELERIAGN